MSRGKVCRSCPLCYSNVRGRSNYRGHRGYREPRSIYRPEVTMALKKPSPAPDDGMCSVGDLLPGFLSPWPLLWEFLVTHRYDDGSSRQLPTLMLFIHDGRLTAALNDRDNQRTAFASGSEPGCILDALEMGLEHDSLVWRPNQTGYQKKRGR